MIFPGGGIDVVGHPEEAQTRGRSYVLDEPRKVLDARGADPVAQGEDRSPQVRDREAWDRDLVAHVHMQKLVTSQ